MEHWMCVCTPEIKWLLTKLHWKKYMILSAIKMLEWLKMLLLVVNV